MDTGEAPVNTNKMANNTLYCLLERNNNGVKSVNIEVWYRKWQIHDRKQFFPAFWNYDNENHISKSRKLKWMNSIRSTSSLK